MKIRSFSRRNRLAIFGGVLTLFLVVMGHRQYQAHHRSENVLAKLYQEGMYAEHRPIFQFAEQVFDFGTITAGEVVEHTYTFTNSGDRPLVIHQVVGSCSGCVTTTWPQEVIAPGNQGQIKAKFNSTDQAGVQTRIIVIRANTDPPEFRLLLKGVVHTP